jgi:hypothetical protein
MNTDTVKIRVYASTKFVGSKDSTVVEFDREDWDNMTGRERDDACLETLFDLINWGYDEVTK